MAARLCRRAGRTIGSGLARQKTGPSLTDRLVRVARPRVESQATKRFDGQQHGQLGRFDGREATQADLATRPAGVARVDLMVQLVARGRLAGRRNEPRSLAQLRVGST